MLFGDNFCAVDDNGKVYIWGALYKEPTLISTDNKIIDVDGKLLLGENGLVYSIDNPNEKIKYLKNVCGISNGENHSLFATLDGYIYSLGNGDLGQLGSGNTNSNNNATLVRTETGYLENCYLVSCRR